MRRPVRTFTIRPGPARSSLMSGKDEYFSTGTIRRALNEFRRVMLRLAPRICVERAFGRFADKAVVIQMHADRERVVADFMECPPRL
jgi:hypothetical protein